MSTFIQLQTLIRDIIQDRSFDTDIPLYLNQGIEQIAGGMPSALGSFVTAPLPDLFSISTVETSIFLPYVAMPTTFQRKLQFIADSSGRKIELYDSMIEFAEDYPLMDKVGKVQSAVEKGGNLYYQRIPTEAETLTLHFYRKPVAMSAPDDTPDGIPEYLQIPLLVNYAAWQVYTLIEDGSSGKEIANTMRYKLFFTEYLHTLELSIPAETRSFSTLGISIEE